MKKVKKNESLSLSQSIVLLVIGIFLGCIFTFGMQHWNQEVSKDNCTIVETQFIDYRITKSHRSANREVILNCSDSKRYFIDGVLINIELKNNLSQLKTNDEITLLIHPNSNSVVEFSTGNVTLIKFDEAIDKLGNEVTEFLVLGVFMYLCALLGFVNVVLNIVKIKKQKNKKTTLNSKK